LQACDSSVTFRLFKQLTYTDVLAHVRLQLLLEPDFADEPLLPNRAPHLHGCACARETGSNLLSTTSVNPWTLCQPL
jgi:hypothetical protein